MYLVLEEDYENTFIHGLFHKLEDAISSVKMSRKGSEVTERCDEFVIMTRKEEFGSSHITIKYIIDYHEPTSDLFS